MGSYDNPPNIYSSLFSFLTIIIMTATLVPKTSAQFKCTTPSTCNSLIEYIPPNTTTLSSLTTLFNLPNYLFLLAANNLSATTPPTTTHPANTTVKIPFPCKCSNGTGTSNPGPIYKVVKDDGLYHIAVDVFAGLVTVQEIQAANNISNPDMIIVGQELRIPLPCSCDDVGGEEVVHYGHIVGPGSTVAGIASDFGTDEQTLLKLNGLASPDDLKAGALLDVPLKGCKSMIQNTSLDYPLLVPNGTYVFTAADCVTCSCNAANNFTLQCSQFQRTQLQIKSSPWRTCPSMQCKGEGNLFIGNTTTSSSCKRTTCAYAGYTNKTILTTLVSDNTCPGGSSDNSGTTTTLQGWSWNFLLIAALYVFM